MRDIGVLLPVGLALAVGAAVSAQRGAPPPATQQPTFRTTTELIQVDTVVVDKDGKPVHGLTKDDFELYDNGKRQDIAALTEFRHEHVALGAGVQPPFVDVAANSGPGAERLVVIVLDDVNTRTYHTERVKAAIGQFLHELGGGLQMALIRTSGRQGVEFTSDTRTLLDGLAGFQGEQMVQDGRGNAFSLGRSSPAPITRPGAGRSLVSVMDVLKYLSPNDGGRKTLLFVSETAPSKVDPHDAAAMVDPTKTPAERLAAQREVLDSLPEGIRNVIAIARQVNASIYAMDPRGLAQPGQEGFDGMAFSRNDIARKDQATLLAMAAETGGYAIANTDDFAGGIARIVDELDNYYVLGFMPPDPAATKPREIEVRVLRPGAEPHFRREYVLNGPPTKAAVAGGKDPLLGLAYSPVPTAALPLKVWAIVPPPDGSGKAAGVALWLDSGDTTIGEYAVYVMDPKKAKETAKPTGRTLSGNVPSLLPLDKVVLQPGRYQLRVAALNEDASLGGSVYLTVDVPDFAKTPLAIAGLLLGDGNTSRRDLGGLPFAPTLDRTFAATRRLRVAFDIWRQPKIGDARVVVDILNLDGSVAKKVDDKVLAPATGRIDAPLSLAGLAPGNYILRITATSGAASAQQDIGFQVRR